MVSVSSRSRSVALKASLERSALTRTLARIGIVLRRSTTRWTWPSDFNRAVRSTVTFMPNPASRTSFKGDESGVSARISQELRRAFGWYPTSGGGSLPWLRQGDLERGLSMRSHSRMDASGTNATAGPEVVVAGHHTPTVVDLIEESFDQVAP